MVGLSLAVVLTLPILHLLQKRARRIEPRRRARGSLISFYQGTLQSSTIPRENFLLLDWNYPLWTVPIQFGSAVADAVFVMPCSRACLLMAKWWKGSGKGTTNSHVPRSPM